MRLTDDIRNYIPGCEQEARDQQQMLRFMQENPDCLSRENLTGHFTASVWVVNPSRTKVLMAYHRIYDSWAWIGGHADGEENLQAVAMRELREETGVKHARLVSGEIFSLETLTVNGHEKRGVYVPCHLHFNVTYLAEAEESETLAVCEAENTAVRWFPVAEALAASTEPWMVQRVYAKLAQRARG